MYALTGYAWFIVAPGPACSAIQSSAASGPAPTTTRSIPGARGIRIALFATTKTAADERLAEVREKVTQTWDKLDKVFDDRVGRALHALNVPTRKDVDVLSKRVHELTVMTKKLSEEEETHGRGRAHRAKAE